MTLPTAKIAFIIIATLFSMSLSADNDNTLYEQTYNDSPEILWGTAEYLYWQIKDSPQPPPLVTEGPVVAPGAPTLDQPGQTVVLGDKKINNGWRSGGRFTIGFGFNNSALLWFPCFVAAEANYFLLEQHSHSQTVQSSGLASSPFLAIPFFNVVTSSESSADLALPGSFSGKATLKISNSLQGAEFNALTIFPWGCHWNISLLTGFRYFNFNEHLNFDTERTLLATSTTLNTKDKFCVNNSFYGGQLGIQTEFTYDNFFFNVKGKIALGGNYEQLRIAGRFITEPQTFLGGYFALPTNIGRHTSCHFAVLPEVDINFGYEPIQNLRVQVGYTFLYVNKMLWAGNQIDRNINPSQAAAITYPAPPALIGQASPRTLFRWSSFWAQGLNIGLTYRY